MKRYGSNLPRSRPNGRTGVTKSCSRVSAFFFADDGKCREERGDVEEHDRGESRQKKLGERESGLKRSLGRMSTANAARSCTTRRRDSSRPIAVLTLMALPATEESEPSMSTRTCALIWCRRRSE